MGCRPANRIPLNALLSDTGHSATADPNERMATTRFTGGFLGLAVVAAEPWPCRLTTQDLVELLKKPTCFGESRTAVPTHLGNRYGRRLGNHWEFVRYAREDNLGLDFTTPPGAPIRRRRSSECSMPSIARRERFCLASFRTGMI
jgi:hypothetical protein